MDELITRHLAGRTTDIEERTLERWREAAPENEEAFRAFEEVWVASAPTAPSTGTTPPSASVIMAEADRRRRRDGWGRRLRSPWAGYGLAAAAVALLLVTGLSRRTAAPTAGLVPTGSSASAGDVVTMSLSDGSVVRLAAGTTVEFPPSDTERRVEMTGRAFFAVAHDEALPFRVRAPGGEITVVGTRFEVSARDGLLRVVVVEGVVQVETGSGAPSAGVRMGQVAYLDEDGLRVSDIADVWTLLDWPGGLLVFQETPLGAVATELEEHFGTPVRIDPSLVERRITGWFGEEPLDEVASAVCLIAGAHCSTTPDGVRIEAR